MKSLFLLFAISSIFFSSIANAKNGLYTSVFGGSAFSSEANIETETVGRYIYHEQTYNPLYIESPLKAYIFDQKTTITSKEGIKLNGAHPFGVEFGYNIGNFSFGLQYTKITSKVSSSQTSTTSELRNDIHQNGNNTTTYQINTSSSNLKSFDKLKTQLLLLNTYYNFNNLHRIIKPFVGIGV